VLEGCYERVNAFMSLLLARRFRRLAAEAAAAGGGVLADLGAGPGYTGLEACRLGLSRVVLLDASPDTLRLASRLLETACGNMHLEVAALFESLPFPSCSFDGAIATFSIRDAIDREKAIREAARILKPEGRLVILDIYRPANTLALIAAKTYFTVIPFLGALLTGCPHLSREYLGLPNTIDRMESFEGMKKLLVRYFRVVNAKTLVPATGLWIAEKPRRPCGAGLEPELLSQGGDYSRFIR
jgi:demethylmenaquinone methyltransferase/2-methoxy-6-polyprenyl-1,4-benzoquinol methylase